VVHLQNKKLKIEYKKYKEKSKKFIASLSA